MPMDYDDNDFHIQNLHLAGEGSSTVSPVLRPYALPKFDYDDSLQGNLRFDSLVENEVFLGITGQEDNQWIEEYSRGSSGIELSSSANNVWSEATSSESVEMLLKSVGQEEGVVGETITDELDASDGPGCLATIMDPNLKQDDGKDHVIDAKKEMVPNKPWDNFSGFSESFDCEKSHITFTSQSREAQIAGGEVDSVVLGKDCNFSVERVDRICADINQDAGNSAFELFKKESKDDLSISRVGYEDMGFTQNFSASKTGDLTKNSLSSEASSIKNKETSMDNPIGSDVRVETLTYSAEKPSVLSSMESLGKPLIEANIPVIESTSMHTDSLATPPIAGFVNVQAIKDDNTKSEILATPEPSMTSPSKVSDVQSRSVEETENADVRNLQQATSDVFEVSVGSDPSEMCEGSSINNLGTNLTNKGSSAEFHAGSIINKDLVACSKTPKAQSGDLTKDKSLTTERSGSVQVNDEIRSSEQGGICMDEDVSFNEGGDARPPLDSSDMDIEVVGALERKNVELTLSAEDCKRPFVIAQGSEDDMTILAEPGAAVKSDSVSSPDTLDGVHLLSGSIATDHIATKSPIHGVSSVHHDNEKKKEAGFLGDGSSADESPKVASMIDCALEEPLSVVEKCASPDRDGNIVHGMAGHCPPVEIIKANMSEQTQKANPDDLGCSTTSAFDSSAKVGDSVEAGGLQDPKESMSGYHRAAPLSLAVNMSAEQQNSTDVMPPSECDASHKRHDEHSSISVDKAQSGSPTNTNNNELLHSAKVTHEMARGAIYENASLLDITEDMKGKMQSVSSNIDKKFAFEVGTIACLEQTGKDQQAFAATQACNMSTNKEGSSINSSNSILDPTKPEETCLPIPQNPATTAIQVGANGNSERKTRRKSTGKESAKNGNRMKEKTPRQSGRVEKSSAMLTSATGHAIQFEELKPQEKIECIIVKPSGILPISTSILPDLNNSTAKFQQPFTDNQQVQLRAQILVYGSLISASPPEEPHMIAAFGQSDGGRETWEGAWHACLERLQSKKSQANSPSTLMQSRSDLKDVGHKTPDPGIKHRSFPSKVLSSPTGGASNKGTPSPVVSPLIPLSSPLWNISTPSCVGFPSSGMPRSALHDYRQSFSPLHPYQAPPVQNSSGHNPPWLSQGPFAGQWVASSPVSAFNTGARFSALPITEAVKLTPVKVSGSPGIKHTYSIPVVHSASPSVFSGASSLSGAKKTTVSSGQASSDTKSRKRKKFTSSVADQTSVPRQAPLASVTAHPVAPLHLVTHTEGYNHAPSLAENQTVSITAPVNSIFSTSVTVSTPASIKSKSSPGRFLSVLSTHEHPKFLDKRVENVVILEETLNKVEECKLQAEDVGVHAAAAAAKTCQSSDSKTIKKKKVTTSVAVNQASVLRQAPGASVTGPVIGYLPHLFRTEGHSQILLLAPNQTESVTAPIVCSPFPTSVAMSTPLSIASKSSTGRFSKAVYPVSTHGYPKPDYQNMEKAVAAEETLSKVKESKLQAENAALLAAAEVSRCQDVWCQMEKQWRSDVVSDDEANLMSSTVSVAAATIAKMAAAAAKIASDVAEQARLMADEVFLSRKNENFDQSSIMSHPNVIKDTPASILKSVDKSNHPNSIISAAREAARRRIQAAEAASKHAENLDAIVKAAELAAEAVSQAGKIVAMGDLSDLRELVEAGPGGYLKNVEAAPNMCTKEIHTMKRGLAQQKPSVHLAANQTIVSDSLSCSIEKNTWIPRAHKGSNLSKATGVAPVTDTGSLHADVSQDMPQSTSGTWEEHNIKEGCLVEVYKDDDKYKGAWLTAKVLSLKDEKALLCYSEIQSSNEGSDQLKEWVPLEVEGNKVPRVRFAHPLITMGFEGTRKRHRMAVTDYSWSNGDRVDVRMQDCWREGVVMEQNKIDLTSISVQFPAQGETLVVRSWHVRPTLIWKDKKWIEWSSSKGGCASEGETPKEKRMKLGSPVKDKGKDKSPKNVDIVESGRHEELGTLPLSAEESSFNVGKSTRDEKKMRSGLQKEGARVIFGVPKPGKKQKFMDVSKHYVAADGSKKNDTANDPIKFARYLKPQVPGWKLNSRNDARENEVAETKTRLKSRKPPVPSFRTLPQKDNNLKATDKTDGDTVSDVENQTKFGSSSNTGDAPKKAFSFTSIPKSEHLNKGKLVPAKVEVKEKSVPEVIEPRRSNRKIQPTSRLLEGLQSSLTISKIPSVSHASQRNHNKVTSRGNNSNDG